MESNTTLLNAARTLDKDALVEIFDLYSSALFKYALRLCADPLMADDIVGAVFDTLLHQFSSGNGPTSNLRSYLFETAYHLIVDEVRRSRRTTPLEVTTFLNSDLNSGRRSLEDELMFQTVMNIVRNDLTEDQQHVIVLRFLEDFSLCETAAIIGKEVNHVKVIQNRAVAKIRQALDYTEIKAAASCANVRKQSRALSIP
jgi:RNA polymerase sigma-70 factor (ECF subfamily)